MPAVSSPGGPVWRVRCAQFGELLGVGVGHDRVGSLIGRGSSSSSAFRRRSARQMSLAHRRSGGAQVEQRGAIRRCSSIGTSRQTPPRCRWRRFRNGKRTVLRQSTHGLCCGRACGTRWACWRSHLDLPGRSPPLPPSVAWRPATAPRPTRVQRHIILGAAVDSSRPTGPRVSPDLECCSAGAPFA